MTTDQDQHTPTPWRAGTQPSNERVIYSRDGRMRLENGGTTLYPVAWCVEFEGEAKHNAEFIARACNSHDELLSACRAALQSAGYTSGEAEPSLRQLNVSIKALDAIRAAIAKATE